MFGLIGAAVAVLARTVTCVRDGRQTAGLGSLNVCMLLSILVCCSDAKVTMQIANKVFSRFSLSQVATLDANEWSISRPFASLRGQLPET